MVADMDDHALIEHIEEILEFDEVEPRIFLESYVFDPARKDDGSLVSFKQRL
jgi:hypothetical protein